MGPIMATLLALVLNLVPVEATAVELQLFVIEGVGFTNDPSVFSLERSEGASWLLHDAHGKPWMLLEAEGSLLRLADPAGANREEVDLVAAIGLPDGAWWEAEEVGPSGAPPLVLERSPGGLDVTLEGMLAATIRW